MDKKKTTFFFSLLFVFILSLPPARAEIEKNDITENTVPTERDLAITHALKAAAEKLGLTQPLLGIHGHIETRNYIDIDRESAREKTYELRNEFLLSKEFALSRHFNAFSSMKGSFDYFYSKDEDFHTGEESIELWELYGDIFSRHFDLRVGKQIIRWGKSDEVNPTDIFTPEDFSEFMNETERAKRKIPVLAAKSNIYYKDFTLESIWIPFFVKSRIDVTDGDWHPYVFHAYRAQGLRILDDDGPDKDINNGNFAFKLKYQGESFDSSISYSNHIAQLPALVVNAANGTVSPQYPRQHTFGGDFETVVGKFGLRGELAYTTDTAFLSYDPLDSDRTVYTEALNWVCGLDYSFPEALYVNLQYAQQFIPNYPHQIATQRIEDSVVWRITKDYLRDTLRVKTTGRYYLSTQDLAFESSIRYKITEDLHATFGIYLFAGDHDSNLFGQYHQNDQLYTRLKYTF